MRPSKNRLGLVAALAVGTILTGCGSDGGSGQVGVFKLTGNNYMYGDNPMGPAPGQQNFAPKFFTVVYMSLGQAGNLSTLKTQFAYFTMPATGAPDIAGVVGRYRTNTWTGGTAPLPIGGTVRNNYGDFGFKGQAKIYVVLDNPGVTIVGQRPIAFTPYGADDPTMQKQLNDNESFYNAAVYDFGDPIKAIYFEDWFRNANGKPIPNDPEVGVGESETGNQTAKVAPKAKRPKITNYSINFNYRVQSAADPNVSIPISIDPDTGNGYDEPPP